MITYSKLDVVQKVFLVLKWYPMYGYEVLGVYAAEQDAEDFCIEQNKIGKPIFDDYGLIEGIYYQVSVESIIPHYKGDHNE